jgi:hypothetical protein
MRESKKSIVISAININEGGALTILRECLKYLNSFDKEKKYNILALVYDKNLCWFSNIKYIEIRKAKKNWLYRIYYEYYYFRILSKRINPYLWLSLHDMTPIVQARITSVYCHNPTPFYSASFKDLYYSYKVFLFSYLYKYLYLINIHKNNYIIVQQNWLREIFE